MVWGREKELDREIKKDKDGEIEIYILRNRGRDRGREVEIVYFIKKIFKIKNVNK